MPTLAERVQALPPELYDEIYDLTFTPSTTEVSITKKYRPPASLRVSQGTGETFAKGYYGNTTIFYVDRASAPKWLRSLEDADIKIKSEIRVETSTVRGQDASRFLRSLNHEGMRAFELCRRRGFEASMVQLLKLQVVFGEPERKLWMVLDDVPKIWDAHLAWMTATAWCEWRFGKVEGAQDTSSENVG